MTTHVSQLASCSSSVGLRRSLTSRNEFSTLPKLPVYKPRRAKATLKTQARQTSASEPKQDRRPHAQSLVASGLAAVAVCFTVEPAHAIGGIEALVAYSQTGSTADLSTPQSVILLAGPLLLAPGLVSTPLLLTGVAQSKMKGAIYQSTATGIAAWCAATLAVSALNL